MPKVKKSEVKVKDKKVNKTSVKSKTEIKTKAIKTVKAVKPASLVAKRGEPATVKIVKKTASVKSAKPAKIKVEKEIKKSAPAQKTETVKTAVKAEQKPTKKKITVQVGTINLKGKEAEILKKYQHGKNDTGSTEVQIALFSAKISQLTKHLKKHGKDSDSKRGLLIMVGKRRRLLNYLAKSNSEQYEKLIKDLGLRK